jgi:Tol biopolymer transport system component
MKTPIAGPGSCLTGGISFIGRAAMGPMAPFASHPLTRWGGIPASSLHRSLTRSYSQGYLLFLRESTLMAQPFDDKSLSTTADAVPVAEQIQTMPGLGRRVFTVFADGSLVYRTGAGLSTQLAWFDRSGKQTRTLGQPEISSAIRLSPDRKRASIGTFDAATGSIDIWLYDVAQVLKIRFTSDPAVEGETTWSPDGRWIVFNSNRKGHFDLYRKASNGTGDEDLLYADENQKYPTSFSPNGKLLLYMVYNDPSSKNQLWILPLDGTAAQVRRPVPFANTTVNSTWGEFSPDGRWIAFASDESKRNEIYVAPYPGPGERRRVSTAGGDQPLWRSDAKRSSTLRRTTVFWLSR